MCSKPVECMRSYEDLFNYFAASRGANNHRRRREKVGAISRCGLWYPIWAKPVQNSGLGLHWKLINHTPPFNVPWCYYPANQPTSTRSSLKKKIRKIISRLKFESMTKFKLFLLISWNKLYYVAFITYLH